MAAVGAPERETSPLLLARTAGVLYLVIIVAAGFGEVVRSGIIVPGDPATTAGNVADSEGLFRLGLAADLVAFLCDAVVAVLFYVLLRPVSRVLSLVAASLRLAHAVISGTNLLNQFVPLLLLGGAGYGAAFGAEGTDALVLLFLEAHGYGYLIGLTFFGLHLCVLGYLFVRSDLFPSVLGVLLVVGAAGYLGEGFTYLLLPAYGTIASAFVVVSAVLAELSLCLWLLVRGVRRKG